MVGPRDTGTEDTPRQADELLGQVYDELRRLAAHFFRSQPANHTLQPTALVHEAYLRLSSVSDAIWENPRHFYCVAARAMRQILLNHGRDRRRLKRGGGRQRVALDEVVTVSDDSPLDLESLELALQALAEVDERKCQIVELRYFAGLSIEKTAEVLQISPATVKSDWAFSRAWLLERMSRSQ